MSSSLDLSFTVSIFIVAALGILLFLYSFFVYLRTVPPVASRLRWTLILLRSVGIVLLLALLFEPILKLVHRDEKPATAAILVDDSKSMGITDRLGSRPSTVQTLLNGPSLKSLEDRIHVAHFRFAQRTASLQPFSPDSLTFNGDATDLAGALGFLAEQSEEDNLQAVVLISDGNYNVGQNPLYAAETLGKPLFVVGVGDSSEQKDVLISKILANDIAYVDSRVPVSVTARSTGFSGQTVQLSLEEGGKNVDHRFLTLKEGREYETTLYFTPHEEGKKKFTVRVSPLEGELTERNNVRSFFVKVLKSKIKVLLIAGAPGPDLPFMRRSLESDPNIQVTPFIQRSRDEFYEGRIPTSAYDDHDAIILIGFPGRSTGSDVLQRVRKSVEDHNQALFVVLSRETDLAQLEVLQPFLPFTVDPIRTAEISVLPFVPAINEFHTLLKLPSGRNPVSLWNALPPVYKTQSSFQAKPESEVIAFARVQNFTLQEPLVVIRKALQRKSLAITGYGIWRWKLLAESSASEGVFDPFVVNAIRWLTTREEEKPVKVVTTKEMYNAGERVEFTAQVYDEQYRPVGDAQVRVRIRSANESEEFLLRPIGEGRFEGAIDNLGEGDYRYSGTASLGQRKLGEDEGRFTVGEQNLEFLITRMNKQFLQQLAFQTGGAYYDPEMVQGLVGDLAKRKFEPKVVVHAEDFELWNRKVVLGLLVLLFSTEWLVRKRSGML